MRVVYTNIKGLAIEGVCVLGLGSMKSLEREWVLNTFVRLRKSPTLPEKMAARQMLACDDKPFRQAFFKIRGRAYFLDFFFVERMLAVEIDGSSHLRRHDVDRRRDADFRSIGIRTLRVSNKDVMSGKLYEKIYKFMYKRCKKPH